MKKTQNRRSLALAASCILALTSSVSGTIILNTNGNFETGNLTGWADFDPTKFTITSDAFQGSFAGVLENTSGGAAAVISKQLNLGQGTLTAGETVTISFWAKGSAANGGVHFAEVFGIEGAPILGGAPLFPGSAYSEYSFDRIVSASGAVDGVTVQFGAITGADAGSTATLFIDNVSVSVVPEPSAILMLGSGLGLFVLRRRRA